MIQPNVKHFQQQRYPQHVCSESEHCYSQVSLQKTTTLCISQIPIRRIKMFKGSGWQELDHFLREPRYGE